MMDPASPEFSLLLEKWHEAEANAAHWKEEENALRIKIFGEAFGDEPKAGKDNKIRLPYDMALIGDYRINYTIDQAALDTSRQLIDPAVFDSVISYRPSVKAAAFRDLDDDTRRPFTNFITAAPGTPGLEIKPASKVRW